MRHRRLAFAFLTAGLLASSALAPADSAARWRNLPLFGGPMGRISVSAETAYLATPTAGLFRTEDEGATWQPVGRGLDSARIYTVSADPRDPRRVFAFTLARDYDNFTPGSLFRSTDGGGSWDRAATGLAGPYPFIYDVAFDPARRDRVYAAADSGLFRSVDGGTTWAHLAFDTSVFMVAVDPRDGRNLLVAALSETFRSTDGGATFASVVSFGLYDRLLFDPTRPGVVWGAAGGLVRSLDGGATWTDTEESIGIQDVAVAADGTLYGATNYGVLRSFDQGTSWVPRPNPSGQQQVGPNDAVSSIAALGGTILAAGSRGIWSFNEREGGPWRAAGRGIATSQIVSLAVAKDSTIYATVPLNGLLLSRDRGESFRSSNQGLRALHQPAFLLAVDPSHPEIVHGAYSGTYLRSEDAGRTWQHFRFDSAPSITVLAVDPSDPDTVYMGGPLRHPNEEPGFCQAIKTTDAGRTWTCLDRDNVLWQLDLLVIDPQQPRTLYAFCSNLLAKSVDGGLSWQRLPSRGLPRSRSCPECGFWISALAIDPSRPQRLYAGSTGGVFRSADRGLTWHKMSRGLAAGDVLQIVIDSTRPDTLYAAIVRGGIYRSTDAGASWSAVGTGLPAHTLFETLAIDPRHPQTLYAGTSGRGLYRIDLDAP